MNFPQDGHVHHKRKKLSGFPEVDSSLGPGSHLSVGGIWKLLLTDSAGMGAVALGSHLICHSLSSARMSPTRGVTRQLCHTSSVGLGNVNPSMNPCSCKV